MAIILMGVWRTLQLHAGIVPESGRSPKLPGYDHPNQVGSPAIRRKCRPQLLGAQLLSCFQDENDLR